MIEIGAGDEVNVVLVVDISDADVVDTSAHKMPKVKFN